VVIGLVRDADLHMVQLMPLPLPLILSCFSKIQISTFTSLVPAHPGSPGQRAVKRVCVCVCVLVGWCLDVDAYTTEDLLFDWRKDAVPVEYNEDIRLPEYDLSGVSHIVCSQNINSTGRLHTVTRSHRIRVLEYLRY